MQKYILQLVTVVQDRARALWNPLRSHRECSWTSLFKGWEKGTFIHQLPLPLAKVCPGPCCSDCHESRATVLEHTGKSKRDMVRLRMACLVIPV